MDVREKIRQHIDGLRAGVSGGSIPSREVLTTVLEKDRSGLSTAIEKHDKLDHGKVTDTIEEVVKLLYQTDVDAAERYGDYVGLTKEDMLELAKIAFDIAKYKNKIENMYALTRQFLLGEKRVNEAVNPKIFNFISEKKYNEAQSLKKKYQRIITREREEKYGMEFFERAMTFGTSQQDRDYETAYWIKKIFNVSDKDTAHLAEVQFEYCLKHDQYSKAVELAENFNLSQEKLYKAVTFAFREKFEKFIGKFDKKEYSGRVKLEDDDPYKQSIELLNKYNVFEKDKKSRDVQGYVKNIKDVAYSFLKKLSYFDEYKDVDLQAKSFFCLSIIADFNLADKSDKVRSEECANISDTILNSMSDNIKGLKDAREYHEMVMKITEEAALQKVTTKKVGTKIFDIYLDNNQFKPMREIYDALKLELNDVFPSLRKKCFDFIEKNDMDSFKKLNGLFDIKDQLNSNEDFLARIYHLFRDLIYSDEFVSALELSRNFKISSKRKLEPLRQKISEFLHQKKDKDARKIIKAFNVKNNQISDILLTIYKKRVAKSVKEGVHFRNSFNISVNEIGFFTWFFTEVFKMPLFRK